jgi:predicted RNase H-like HicB family nuclease
MQIVLDPKLLDLIEYDIWRSSEDNAWICVAGRLPFIGDISGHGDDPESALKECRIALAAAFETFNK